MEMIVTGLSTFSGLDTYRYIKEYIHDNTYNFNTSQHTRGGYCVPGVYYKDISNPQINYIYYQIIIIYVKI